VNHYETSDGINDRIGDLEEWMLATTDGINNKIIPTIARSSRIIEGLSKRLDSLYKFRNNPPNL